MKPGSKVLYLGAASGTTVSHVSDLVGPVSRVGISCGACGGGGGGVCVRVCGGGNYCQKCVRPCLSCKSHWKSL